ncbi:MAG: hypothetical protein ABSB87_05520 [Terriglobales bacterium]|jgi:uncharacterized membrane protein YdfJ with MMPL/SSD domain
MFKFWLTVLASIATLLLAGVMVANAAPTQPEKATAAPTPTAAAEKAEREKKLADATEAAKKLLLLMDTDKSGKVSKQEWMRFMEAEFDRLDTNHDGQLDVKELTQSQMRVHAFVGK